MIHENTGGLLLLLALVASVQLLKGFDRHGAFGTAQEREAVFVQILGDVPSPGVYSFSHPPDLEDLLRRGGGLKPDAAVDSLPAGGPYHSGAKVEIEAGRAALRVDGGTMSPFYKMTLGLPVSLNRAGEEGLTAIPGIGPILASAIVREREKRGGFLSTRELLSIKGIGPATYRRISPHLKP